MLNINNIDSDFNKRNMRVTEIAKILGQPYTTVVNKKNKGNWSANDVEKFANYFNRSILYYFDKEDPRQVNDPEATYFHCKECIKKQKTIDEITAERDLLRVELLELYRGKKGRECG